MTLYLVERKLPGLSNKHLVALQEALSEASRRLIASGSPVRYRGSTFLPGRGRVFCLFEAHSQGVVRAVNEMALVPFVAIHDAVEFPVIDGNQQEQRCADQARTEPEST